MERVEYKISEYLSSRQFYYMLTGLSGICEMGRQILIDLSDVKRVDGNVIPVLILMGEWIEEKTGIMPVIRLGRDFKAGYLKKYLDGIGFYRYTYGIYLYEDEYDQYGGYLGKNMDEKNGIMYFPYPSSGLDRTTTKQQKQEVLSRESEAAKQRIFREVIPFLSAYIRKKRDMYYEVIVDRIADILSQIVANSIIWGDSKSYLTIQANHKRNQILLAVADKGIGMSKSLQKQLINASYKDEGYIHFDKKKFNEFEAIVQSLYYRKKSETYGLYNVIKDVLDVKGIVRVHSNTKQIILTHNVREAFLNAELERVISEYNLRETVFFPGVHYEICIPMESDDENHII